MGEESTKASESAQYGPLIPQLAALLLRRSTVAVARRGTAARPPEPQAAPAGADRPAGTGPSRKGPSFAAAHDANQRIVMDAARLGIVRTAGAESTALPPRFYLQRKLRGREIAAGHAVKVPDLLGRWDTADEIDLADMPDEFVLKSDGGAASNGVFPLRRTEGGVGVITKQKVHTQDSIKEILGEKARHKRVTGPYFAESLIQGAAPGELPEDIKISAFYGEICHVHIRRVKEHQAGRTVAVSRFVDEHGESLPGIRPDLPGDDTIPLPDRFDEAVATARVLSRASRLPYVRVDLYSTPGGVYFGEFTPRPGGGAKYSPEHDELMGTMLERAQLRIEVDLARGMAFQHDFGSAV